METLGTRERKRNVDGNASGGNVPHCLMIKDADEEAEISLVPHQIKWS